MAIRNPAPSSPTSRSTGTRAPSKTIWAGGEERRPIVRSGICGSSPGVSASAITQEIPAGPGPPVRQKTL
jgi:hypothetical protein